MPEEVICLPFPSQKQEQVPKAAFKHPKQVALLFKLQRKLDYRADDGQAAVFDGLEHGDKKRILDKALGRRTAGGCAR